MRRVLLGLTLVGLLFVAAESHAVEPRVVVAIANNQGLPQDRRLRYSHDDAVGFVKAMREVGGVKENDVHLILEATPERVLQEFSTLAKSMGRGVTLITFYSGHGSEGALHLGGKKLQISELQRAIEAVPARLKLTFIDACRGAGADKGFEDAEPFVIEPPISHEGQVMVQAAGPGELAHESDELKSGIFTHFLVSGLLGAADSDGDSRVQLEEAYRFAYEKTRWAMLMRGVVVPGGPELQSLLRGQGPLTLTDLRVASSNLSLLPDPQETYYVVVAKGTGRELAQAWSAPARTTRLALPAGQFVVHRRGAGVPGRAEVTLPIGGNRTLAAGDFLPDAPPTATELKGGRDAFSGESPFPHRVGAAVTLQADDSEDWSAAPGFSLSYAYGTSGWLPYAVFSAWQRQYSKGTVLDRSGASLGAGLRYQAILPRASLSAGAALAMTGIRQRTFDRNRDQSTTLEQALGAGLRTDLGASFPLTGQLSAELGVAGLADVFAADPNAPEAASWITVAGYSLQASLLVSLGLTVGL